MSLAPPTGLTARAGLRGSMLLPLAAPLVVSFWFRATFAWADAAFASFLTAPDGSPIGDASIAAIGLTQPIEFLQIALWVGTSNGLTARLAAAMGAGEGAKVEQLKRASLRIISLLIAGFVALAIGMWFWIPHLNLDPVVARQYQIYATVIVAGGALTSFWSILPDSLVKAHHDTRSTMWAGLLSSSLNVVLNALFVFVLHWGIFGIALSTVIGRIAGLAYALGRASTLERSRRGQSGQANPGLDLAPVRSILSIAVPSGITYVLMALESQFVNLVLARGEGATPLLAAWTIYDRSVRFMAMPIIAASVAMLPLAARLHGARDHQRVRREGAVGIRAATLYALLLVAPLVFFAGDWVARALGDAPETRVFAVEAMQWLPVMIVCAAPFLISRAAWDGMQRPLPGFVFTVLRTFGLTLPLVWLARQHHDSLGLSAIQGVVLSAGLAGVVATAGFWWWSSMALRRLDLPAAESAPS